MTGWVIEVEQKTREEEGGGCDGDDYLSVDYSGVFSGVCVHAGKMTSSTLEHIQVQELFYNFYICIV